MGATNLPIQDAVFMTFEQWAAHIREGYEGKPVGNRMWIAVGEWLLNAKENNAYTSESVGYHLCKGNYERIYAKELGLTGASALLGSVTDIEEACGMCGEAMPEGIRMVALLEKL